MPVKNDTNRLTFLHANGHEHRAAMAEYLRPSCVQGLPRLRFQSLSPVGPGMGSNPIRSHFC